MPSDSPDAPESSGLQSVLARLRGMMQALRSIDPEAEEDADMAPGWDSTTEPGRATEEPPADAVQRRLGRPDAGRTALSPSALERGDRRPSGQPGLD